MTSIINQYTANSKTLNVIFNKADASGNGNGKIDTPEERSAVNKFAEQYKKKLEAEGVSLKRCNDQAGTSVDFKRGESVFTVKMNKFGNVETLANYKEDGEHEEIAKFFGLEKSSFSKVTNFFGIQQPEYQDQSGNNFAAWGPNKLWNIISIPGKAGNN